MNADLVETSNQDWKGFGSNVSIQLASIWAKWIAPPPLMITCPQLFEPFSPQLFEPFSPQLFEPFRPQLFEPFRHPAIWIL